MKNEYTDILLDFIHKTPNAFWCTYNLAQRLEKEQFVRLYENEKWNLEDNKGYYVIRHDASIIAFRTVKNADRFLLTASHGDSPSFHLKTNASLFEKGYLKLNTEFYGGMVNTAWLDRPLSIAGRGIIKTDKGFETRLINIDKDLLVIPNQAVHINREDRPQINPQKDLLPIMALTDDSDTLQNLLNEAAGAEVLEADLYLYCRETPTYFGSKDDFVLCPRLDDLACAIGTFEGFIRAKQHNNAIQVYTCFDKEEVGSLNSHAADSTFLSDVLARIAEDMDMDLRCAISNSFLVSADNGHASHPNAPEKNDPTNFVGINKGIVIKHHQNYTTNALSSVVLKDIFKQAGVKYQDFSCRSDVRCGTTLGKITLSHVSVHSVDIGLPQLAMHSAMETCGSEDFRDLVNGMLAFYESNFTIIG